MGGGAVPRESALFGPPSTRGVQSCSSVTDRQLTAECADPPQSWSPSSPPANFGVPSRPASAQATRKSRAGGIGSSNLNPSRNGTPEPRQQGAGSGNEAFFERLGGQNASRPDHLPPSQGGRYAGFGSQPDQDPSIPSLSSSHPSYATSSHSVPTLDDLQRDPAAALTKGWGFFSSALASATKEIRSSVVDPGLARAQQLAAEGGGDDWKNLLGQVQNSAKSAAGWAGQRAGEGWEGLNHVAKERGGLDLNEQLGRLGVTGRSDSGYGRLERAEDGVVSPHGGRGDDDFFESWDDHPASAPSASRPAPAAAPAAKKVEKKGEWDQDDEWKDF